MIDYYTNKKKNYFKFKNLKQKTKFLNIFKMQEVHYLYKEIETGAYNQFVTRIIDEEELLGLAKIIMVQEKGVESILSKVLNDYSLLTPYNKYFDWNIASTIQHLDSIIVVKAFRKSFNKKMYHSIGLTWVFGEFQIQDEFVISYLYKAIKLANNSSAWWRAAFSLEQLKKEEAIIFLKKVLKAEGLKSLDFYLSNISSKKSVIGILLMCNNKEIKDTIFGQLKRLFLESTENDELINSIWLLGRLKLIDKEIAKKVNRILTENANYELVYYTCYAIRESSSPMFFDTFQSLLKSKDSLLRKMAVRGLSYIENTVTIKLLEEMLIGEHNPYVINEISKSIYRVLNASTKEKIRLKKKFSAVENGLIIDQSDKWYADPSIYDIFSNAEDPENICLHLILRELKVRFLEVKNPIDLATGTGRVLKFLLNELSFSGSVYGVDLSNQMLEYTKIDIDRNHNYIHNVELVNQSLLELDLGITSDFIISSFGFPSKITNRKQSLLELEKVYKHLNKKGVFVTYGWDESFNDDLSNFWFKHIPDGIEADNFETWRIKRKEKIISARNCDLTWYKTGLNVPLQFKNVYESARIMGYLFGRDAADHIIENNMTEWGMSLGITLNTKEEIEEILIKNNIIGISKNGDL